MTKERIDKKKLFYEKTYELTLLTEPTKWTDCIDIRCNICGNEFTRTCRSLTCRSGIKCPECKHKESVQRRLEKKRERNKRNRIEKNMELYGMPYSPISGRYIKTPEDDVKKTFEEQYPEWEYAGGYKNCDSPIMIKCKSCGTVIQKSFVTIRKKRPLMPCKECAARAKAAARKAAEEERTARAEEKRRQYEESFVDKTCKICGKPFRTRKQRQVCCSPECAHKANLRYATKKKDRRFGRPAKIHWRDIALRVGNMTCQLCGRPCDENDYIVDARGTVICGDNFPSVDHIVPAALGGTDTWDNVQLAHRACNSKKSAHSMVMFVTDQASMNF